MHSTTQDLILSFEQLAASLQTLRGQILSNPLPYWLMQQSEQESTLANAAQTICNLWYQDKRDGRMTDNLYGLIAADEILFKQIELVNLRKLEFKQSVQQFKHSQTNKTSMLSDLLRERNQLLAESLEHSGLARLHLKQCYRQIPLLHAHPEKVGFSWYTSGRSIRKLTVNQAEKMLMKMDYSQPHIQIQLEALGKLAPDTLLAQLQTQVPVMRANMLWLENGTKNRKARNCPLPLFYLHDAKKTFPDYNVPPVTPPEKRIRELRSDLQIEAASFIPSLRIHRYKDK